MGYTVYWYQMRAYTAPEWKKIVDLGKQIVAAAKKAGIEICYECDAPDKPPLVDSRCVRFNGKGGAGHETVLLVKDPRYPEWQMREPRDTGGYFNFCKTAYKPYGNALITLLRGAERIAPGVLKISSDDSEGEPPAHTELTLEPIKHRMPKLKENDLSQVDMQKLANFLANLDGHDILAPGGITKLGFAPAWVKKITKTIKSDGTPKGCLIANDGRLVDKMTGVDALSFMWKLLQSYSIENTSRAIGCGFRCRQMMEDFYKGMGDKLPKPQIPNEAREDPVPAAA